jgi:release factor glutamine methyltransferase
VSEAPRKSAVTVRELCLSARQRLRKAGIEEAEIEADLLLGHLLGCSRTQLVMAGRQPVSSATIGQVEELLVRRERREPLAYILGEWEFWSLPFEVTPAVLIPRPETELLLEKALPVFKGEKEEPRLLDLGVGSGVIPVVLALELPRAAVYGLDCSWAALRVAKRNARRHEVDGRIRFFASDWLSGVIPRPFFDGVLANPPYIACQALANLQPEVRDHEPHLALAGGQDGLASIAPLSVEILKVLKPGGWLFMEIGFDQGESAVRVLQACDCYEEIQVHRDLAGHPRILQARKRI